MRAVLFFTLTVGILAGCLTYDRRMISPEEFPPTPAHQTIRLFVTDVDEPYKMVAFVQSLSSPNRDQETQREQLVYLREVAREVGADAVIHIAQFNDQIRGFVPDDATPFPSVRQGRTNTYFVRGIAIRYIDDPEPDELDLLLEELERQMEGEPAPPPTETEDETEELEITDEVAAHSHYHGRHTHEHLHEMHHHARDEQDDVLRLAGNLPLRGEVVGAMEPVRDHHHHHHH